MPTHQQFLDAISAAPDDLALRLMYADWLEEQGDPLCGEWRKPMVRIRMKSDSTNNDGTGDGRGFGYGFGWRNGDGFGSGHSYSDGFGERRGTGTGSGYYNELLPSLGLLGGRGAGYRIMHNQGSNYGDHWGDGGSYMGS